MSEKIIQREEADPTHEDPHPQAGKTVRVKMGCKHPQFDQFGGTDFRLVDWADRVNKRSIGRADAIYEKRRKMVNDESERNSNLQPIPIDGETVFGKLGPIGNILHVSELDEDSFPKAVEIESEMVVTEGFVAEVNPADVDEDDVEDIED